MSLPIPMSEVCAKLKVTPPTVKQWAADGKVRLWQPNGKRSKLFVYLDGGAANDNEIVQAWLDAEKKKTAT